MSNKIITLVCFAIFSLVPFTTFAVEFDGLMDVPVIVTKTDNSAMSMATKKQKKVTLLKVKLTKKEKQILQDVNNRASSSEVPTKRAHWPSRVDLGMNDVPVLDQGPHGSCVTFATTAAIDAALYGSDYVSQLCSLELGSYLVPWSYLPSGWEGASGSTVISQLLRFGIISKENQFQKTCAGIREYPLYDGSNQGVPISLGEYRQKSEDINDKVSVTDHVRWGDTFTEFFYKHGGSNEALSRVKAALRNGHRVAFGMFLFVSEDCMAGACGQYRKTNDTWVRTSVSRYVTDDNTAGHEMLIYGYDDNAYVTGEHGKRHYGLLKMRNSWGDQVGDNGDYYMTYDYFKVNLNEVHEIIARN